MCAASEHGGVCCPKGPCFPKRKNIKLKRIKSSHFERTLREHKTLPLDHRLTEREEMDFKWQLTALGQTNAVLINQKFRRRFPPLQPAAVQCWYCLKIRKKIWKKATHNKTPNKPPSILQSRHRIKHGDEQQSDSSSQGRLCLLAITTEPFPELQRQTGMTQRSQHTHFKATDREKVVAHFHCYRRCVLAPAAAVEFSREPWSATWPQFYCSWLRLIQF